MNRELSPSTNPFLSKARSPAGSFLLALSFGLLSANSSVDDDSMFAPSELHSAVASKRSEAGFPLQLACLMFSTPKNKMTGSRQYWRQTLIRCRVKRSVSHRSYAALRSVWVGSRFPIYLACLFLRNIQCSKKHILNLNG